MLQADFFAAHVQETLSINAVLFTVPLSLFTQSSSEDGKKKICSNCTHLLSWKNGIFFASLAVNFSYTTAHERFAIWYKLLSHTEFHFHLHELFVPPSPTCLVASQFCNFFRNKSCTETPISSLGTYIENPIATSNCSLSGVYGQVPCEGVASMGVPN